MSMKSNPGLYFTTTKTKVDCSHLARSFGLCMQSILLCSSISYFQQKFTHGHSHMTYVGKEHNLCLNHNFFLFRNVTFMFTLTCHLRVQNLFIFITNFTADEPLVKHIFLHLTSFNCLHYVLLKSFLLAKSCYIFCIKKINCT